jgi:hypothetical protein
MKIGAATPYDFQGANLTAYGGLLPVAAMLEKLRFQELIEEHVTIKRLTTSMPGFRFVLAMVLALYVGFARLSHLAFLSREPMLTGILEVRTLPVQSTFWRFLASLHLTVVRQLLEVGRQMRQRVWEAAYVELKEVTLDTDTTVQTVYGRQMGARKGYNPQHRGKKSYQPILTFVAETREYVSGELRKGDRPTGKQIIAHLESVFAALPATVERTYARADSGFYCREAVAAYEKHDSRFVVSAQKTPRLIEELQAARWTGSPRTDADGQCELRYQPEGWGKAYRFVALRYQKMPKPKKGGGAGAIPVVRHTPIQLSGVRHRPHGADRRGGGVLPATGGGGESDQRSQQRRGLGGAAIGAVGDELRAFPVGDAGLQPELLADAVQPGGIRQDRGLAPHHAGDGAPALPLPGCQDRAACRNGPGAVQRSLRGKGNDGTVDGSATLNRAER